MSEGRVILDLCGGTGSWSAPYRDAGYDVRLVTLPDHDVRSYAPPRGVHGVLAAPPCTEFAASGARWWSGKPPELLAEACEVVEACLRIIAEARPRWWALEQPVGRFESYFPGLGPPRMRFDPCDYGDPYTKKTMIYGEFRPPFKRALIEATLGSMMHKLPPTPDRAALRSVTPPGFARAFFEANP